MTDGSVSEHALYARADEAESDSPGVGAPARLDARGEQARLAEELSRQMAAGAEGDSNEAPGGEAAPRAGDEPDAAGEPEGALESGREDGPEDAEIHTAEAFARQARMAEAILFAAPDAVDEAEIALRLPAGADVGAVLEALRAQYENRGVVLVRTGKRWRFQTAPDVSHVLERERVEPRRLSRAALETLAIIAYHQPCTRAEVEDVRGVSVARGSLDQLLEIGWIRPKGRRKDTPGRPVTYATTPEFLEHFSLESVSDLPGMADLKAAGLLDARLPPGFSVPVPRDPGEAAEDGEGEGEEPVEFAQEFIEGGAPDAAAEPDEGDHGGENTQS